MMDVSSTVLKNIGLAAFTAASLSGACAGAHAQANRDAASGKDNLADPEAIVTALRANAGNLPLARASFARGRCVRGSYEPEPGAARITKSASFTKPGNILGRFSVGGGNPKVAETNPAVLRGLSLRFEGADGSSDLLLENAPVHFAKSMEQMLGFLKARAPGSDGKPDAAKVKVFSESNPETLNQAKFVAARPLPGSFAGSIYWGVHAFPATTADGKTRFIKFKAVPVAGEITLSEDTAKTMPPDFLSEDLKKRVSDGAVKFDLLAILDRPGDPVMDVTIRWPDEDDRETVRLGSISISSIDENATCDAFAFDPSNLAEGIGSPPDEMFEARKTAYAISFAKRQE